MRAMSFWLGSAVGGVLFTLALWFELYAAALVWSAGSTAITFAVAIYIAYDQARRRRRWAEDQIERDRSILRNVELHLEALAREKRGFSESGLGAVERAHARNRRNARTRKRK